MSRFLEDATDQQWPALRLFSLYRILVATIFLAIGFLVNKVSFLESINPVTLQWICLLYVLISVVALMCTYFRWIPYRPQVYVSIFLDIAAITLIMHLLGGVSTGFGTLMIAVVAGGSLLLPGRSALMFAALATLAILLHEILFKYTRYF